ncbi:hypothetical protein KFK09_011438 [Dendrobium nobile]|uniref:Endonuclease/exonuclease/phosphatase domain-containing protein n=1 Tax=Dendrobium nobile TaxID=94219 RepID=A0A8T3BCM3_DENNO|nr:hypothetical protein KFK09_011438 [Dendrobium nobile]
MSGLLFWNCRGAKKVEAALYLREAIKDHGVIFVGLLETRINNVENNQIMKLLADNWKFFMVPSVGLSGGLLILWRCDLADFTVVKHSSQMVVGNLKMINKGDWKIALVYGSTDVQERKFLWEDLGRQCDDDSPLIIGGDFNCILSQEEKRGGKKFKMNQGSKDFPSFMINNDLHLVNSMGPKYTWCNNKSGSNRIWEKLDRCLINSSAMNFLHLALVKHLPRFASVHCPLVMELFKPVNSVRKDIRYEEVWATYYGATALVKKIWEKKCSGNPAVILSKKCKKTLRALFFWS